MKKRLIGMIAASAAAAAALSVTASPAQAATKVPLNVTVGRQTDGGAVNSIRVNGECVRNLSKGNTSTNVMVDPSKRPEVLTYSGGACESSTQNKQEAMQYSNQISHYWVGIGRIY